MKTVKHMKSTTSTSITFNNYQYVANIISSMHPPSLDYFKANPRFPIISSITIQYVSLKERDFLKRTSNTITRPQKINK